MMLGAVWSKTSFGLTVLRLTRGDRQKVRALVLAIIATMNSFIIFNVVAVWVQCGIYVDAEGRFVREEDVPIELKRDDNCLSKKFTSCSMMFAGSEYLPSLSGLFLL